MDSSIHLPGAWLNEPLTTEEGAQVIDLFTRVSNVKPDDNPAEAAQAVMPYMNSLMHLMYLLTKRSRGLKATDDGIVDSAGKPFDLPAYTVSFVVDMFDKRTLPEEITPEQVQAILPQLSSVIPQQHVIPNNKLANSLTKDIIDAGAIDLVVSGRGKSEITTRCILSYEGEQVKLSSRQPFTEYDRQVADAVTSLYEYGDESHIITAATVYRAMVHATDTETPSPQQIGAVTRSLDKMRFVRVQIDCSEELTRRKLSLNGAQVTGGKIDTYLLALDKIEVTAGGQKVTAYKVIKTPILYDYSRLTGQVITVPAALLDIRDKDGAKVANTDRRIAIKGYLMRRISVMKGKSGNRQSNHILYASIYDEVNDGKELTRRDQQLIREYIALVLNSWKREGFIKGYTELAQGRKKTGVEVSV